MKSVKGKMMVFISLIMVVVCMGFGIVAYSITSNIMIKESQGTMEELAAQGTKLIKERLEVQLNGLATLASNEKIIDENVPWEEKKEILSQEKERKGHVSMAIVDLQGNFKNTEGQTANVQTRPYFDVGISGQANVPEPFYSDVTESMLVTYVVPIYNDGKVTGLLIAARDGNDLSSIINGITYGDTGRAYMLGATGDIIAHEDEELVINAENYIEKSEEDQNLVQLAGIMKKMIAGEKGVGQYSYSGIIKYAGYAPVEGTGWSISLAVPRSEILQHLKKLQNSIIVISLLFLLISIIGGIFLAGSIANPIISISEQLKIVAKGDFTHETPKKLLKKKDEIGILAKAIDSMQKEIKTVINGVIKESNNVGSSVSVMFKRISELNDQIEEVSATTEELSAGMEETAASMQEMNATSDEIERGMEAIAERSQEGAKAASDIAVKANGLRDSFMSSRKNALEIFSNVKEKLEQALEDSKSVEQINTLADAILQITSQTNLLALNAAIEAARAGEAGKGFAVVADEIRTLAEDSKNTVTQIQGITKTMVQSVESLAQNSNNLLEFMSNDVDKDYKVMLEATEEYKKDAVFIDNLVSDFSATSEEVLASIQNMAKGIAEVSSASNEGAIGTTNIAQKASIVVQKADEVISHVESSNKSSEKLMNLVLSFKV